MKLSASCAGAALVAAVLVGSAGEASAARRVGARLPSYDVTSNCSLAQRGMALCLSANDGDRAFLRRVWASTPAAVRARCVGAVDRNDPRAYAELASCVYPVVGWGYTRDRSYGYDDPGLTRVDRRRRAECEPGEVFPLSGLCNQPGDSGRGSRGAGTTSVRDPGGNTPSTPGTPSGPSYAGGYGTVTTTTITTEIHGSNGTVTGTETRSGSTTTFIR